MKKYYQYLMLVAFVLLVFDCHEVMAKPPLAEDLAKSEEVFLQDCRKGAGLTGGILDFGAESLFIDRGESCSDLRPLSNLNYSCYVCTQGFSTLNKRILSSNLTILNANLTENPPNIYLKKEGVNDKYIKLLCNTPPSAGKETICRIFARFLRQDKVLYISPDVKIEKVENKANTAPAPQQRGFASEKDKIEKI